MNAQIILAKTLEAALTILVAAFACAPKVLKGMTAKKVTDYVLA